MTALVHAVVDEGRVLVLEYKDAIVPMISRNKSLTEHLYRGDRVTVQYTVRQKPAYPLHVDGSILGFSDDWETNTVSVDANYKHRGLSVHGEFFYQTLENHHEFLLWTFCTLDYFFASL